METAEQQSTTAPDLTQAQPSNLAQQERTTVATWIAPTWDAERIALAKKSVCPPNTTDAEFDFFVAWCRRTGLDPFIQQAYLVPRKAKDARGNWVEKMQPMAAVAGLAARADAMPDFRGICSDKVYAGDEFMVDARRGEVTHVWSLEARAAKGNKLLGAWAKVTRDGRITPVTYLTLAERDPANGSPFWTAAKAPGQILKCAEAEAYRKAFPNTFAGVYVEAEMQRPDEVEINEAPATTSASATAKSDALKAKLGVKPVAKPATVDQVQTAAAAPKPTPPATDAKAKASSTPTIDRIRFGAAKHALIADASTIELEEALAVAHKQLANCTGKEPWVQSVREGVDAIDREIEARMGVTDQPATDAGTTDAAPEPGSEG